MNSIVTTLTTVAHFSAKGTERFLLQKSWDNSKPTLAVIMMAPSIAEGIAMDNTTLLVLNNAFRLGYGSVAIVNLFAKLNDFALKEAEAEDEENLKAILAAAQAADAVVYAPGVGKAKNKAFQRRQEQVLTALQPMEDKLFCLCNEEGNARLQHPLSPAVRNWCLSPLKLSELLPQAKEAPSQKKKAASKPKERAAKERKSKETVAAEIVPLIIPREEPKAPDEPMP